MTDKREDLIEEAAKALHRAAWGAEIAEPADLDYMAEMRRQAQMVLAVFEQARTPTDDEREALLTAIDPSRRRIAAASRAADRILAAGFRRTVQGEPALLECPHWSPGKVTMRKGCTACAAVQGEPICDHDWRNRVAGGSLCSKCNLWQDERVPVKGEPTDAQVKAALDAAVAYYATTWVGEIDPEPEPVDFEAMRAALRAAAAAEQGGEQ